MQRNKLSGNGRWESSRFILPELREGINEASKRALRKPKPQLEEDELEQFGQLLQESAARAIEVRVSIFDEYQDREIIGTVLRIDHYALRIRIAGEWVSLKDIVKVQRED